MRDRKTATVAATIGVLLILVVGLVVAGNMRGNEGRTAGGNVKTPGSSSADAVQTGSVTIRNYAFSPAAVKVKKGTTVTWTNQDTVRHNVKTAEGAPAAFEGPLLDQGMSYSYTFTQAGTYNYFCQPHPYMKGSVIVTD